MKTKTPQERVEEERKQWNKLIDFLVNEKGKKEVDLPKLRDVALKRFEQAVTDTQRECREERDEEILKDVADWYYHNNPSRPRYSDIMRIVTKEE